MATCGQLDLAWSSKEGLGRVGGARMATSKLALGRSSAGGRVGVGRGCGDQQRGETHGADEGREGGEEVGLGLDHDDVEVVDRLGDDAEPRGEQLPY
eukprot:5339401-Prymnesium_polylepis.2